MSLTPEETDALMDSVRRVIDDKLHDLRVATQIAIARGTVKAVDDQSDLQELQTEALNGEVLDEVEHFQPYGYTSNPPIGSEACLVTVGDDRAHMIALGVNDRAVRCTDLDLGDTCMYSLHGTEIHHRILDTEAVIVVTVPARGSILLGDESAEDPVALESKVHTSLELITAAVTTWANAILGPAPTKAECVTFATALVAAVNRPTTVPPGAGPLVGATKVVGV